MAEQMKFCRSCGKQIRAAAKFCRYCGLHFEVPVMGEANLNMLKEIRTGYI